MGRKYAPHKNKMMLVGVFLLQCILASSTGFIRVNTTPREFPLLRHTAACNTANYSPLKGNTLILTHNYIPVKRNTLILTHNYSPLKRNTLILTHDFNIALQENMDIELNRTVDDWYREYEWKFPRKKDTY